LRDSLAGKPGGDFSVCRVVSLKIAWSCGLRRDIKLTVPAIRTTAVECNQRILNPNPVTWEQCFDLVGIQRLAYAASKRFARAWVEGLAIAATRRQVSLERLL
jgi:hypothetical protein